MKALDHYAKEKAGKNGFVSYLQRTLRNRYINLYRQERFLVKDNHYTSDEELMCEPSFIWEVLAFDYSKDAMLIINMIAKRSGRAMAHPGRASVRRAFSELGLDCTAPLKEVYSKLKRDLGLTKQLLVSTNGKCDVCHFSKKGVCYGNR